MSGWSRGRRTVGSVPRGLFRSRERLPHRESLRRWRRRCVGRRSSARISESFFSRVPGISGTEGCDEACATQFSCRPGRPGICFLWCHGWRWWGEGHLCKGPRCGRLGGNASALSLFRFQAPRRCCPRASTTGRISCKSPRAHPIGRFCLGEIVYRPPVSEIVTLDQHGEHLLQLRGSKMLILIRLHHYRPLY